MFVHSMLGDSIVHATEVVCSWVVYKRHVDVIPTFISL